MSRQFWALRKNLKHGVYEISVFGKTRFEVYVRGELLDGVFESRADADAAFRRGG